MSRYRTTLSSSHLNKLVLQHNHLEQATNPRKFSQCQEKTPIRAFSLLKIHSSCPFMIKNLLRHYAK